MSTDFNKQEVEAKQDVIILDLTHTEKEHYKEQLAKAAFLLHHVSEGFKPEVKRSVDSLHALYNALTE